MSYYYYRVPKVEEDKVQCWGFRKVNTAELSAILERVTRPTYNSRLHNMEHIQADNHKDMHNRILARKPPVACKKSRPESSPSTTTLSERRLSDRELQRVIRRLRRPTVSYGASRYDFTPPALSLSEEKLIRPKSSPGDERRKAFQQLSRPTTASRAKTIGDCILCADDDDIEQKNSLEPFHYDDWQEKAVPVEELDYIVERVSAPTFSQLRVRCPRTPQILNEVQVREKVPLVSGLARSRNVKEIVQRLHSGKSRHVPPSTEITIFVSRTGVE